MIRDCAIGYRTFGTLNPDKSNAVLFPTAFGWRSAGLASRIGAGKLGLQIALAEEPISIGNYGGYEDSI